MDYTKTASSGYLMMEPQKLTRWGLFSSLSPIMTEPTWHSCPPAPEPQQLNPPGQVGPAHRCKLRNYLILLRFLNSTFCQTIIFMTRKPEPWAEENWGITTFYEQFSDYNSSTNCHFMWKPSNRVTSSSCYNFVRVLQNFWTGLLPLFVKILHF